MSKNPLDLYRLDEACIVFFAGLDVVEKDLRREAKHGRLTLTRIGKREYVTEAAIREMLDRCQERKVQPGYGSNSERDEEQSGKSLTQAERSALAFLKESEGAPKKRLPRTSQGRTKSRADIVHR